MTRRRRPVRAGHGHDDSDSPSSSRTRSHHPATALVAAFSTTTSTPDRKGKGREVEPIVQGTSVVAVPTITLSTTGSWSRPTPAGNQFATTAGASVLPSPSAGGERNEDLGLERMTAFTMPGRSMAVPPWGLIAIGSLLVMVTFIYALGFCLGWSYRSDFRKRVASQRAIMLPSDSPDSSPLPNKDHLSPHPHPPAFARSETGSPIIPVAIPRTGRFSIGGDVPTSPFARLASHSRCESVIVAAQDVSHIPVSPGAHRVRFSMFAPHSPTVLKKGSGNWRGLAIEAQAASDATTEGRKGGGHRRTMSHPHSHHRSNSAAGVTFAAPPKLDRAPQQSTHNPTKAPAGFLAARRLKAGSTMLAKVPAALNAFAHHHTSPQKERRRDDLWGGTYDQAAEEGVSLPPPKAAGWMDSNSPAEDPHHPITPHVFPPPQRGGVLDALAASATNAGLVSSQSYASPYGGEVVRSPRSPPLTDPTLRVGGKGREEDGFPFDKPVGPGRPVGILKNSLHRKPPSPPRTREDGVSRTTAKPRAPIAGTMASGGARNSSFVNNMAPPRRR